MQLDALVSGVAAAAETPIALVSVVTDEQQFFRANIGLTGELAQARATPVNDSFCQFVVQGEVPFMVTDAPTDLRVPQALVESEGIRAYLGVPLRYRGEIVGSVCAIDTKPREFTTTQVEALQALAGYIEQRLEELRLLRNSR